MSNADVLLDILPGEELRKIREEILEPILSRKANCWFVKSLPYCGRSAIVKRIVTGPIGGGDEFYTKLSERYLIKVVDVPAEKEEVTEIVDRFSGQDGRNLLLVINSLDSVANERRMKIFRELVGLYYKWPLRVKLIFGQGWEEVEGLRELLGEFYGYYLTNESWIGLRSPAAVKKYLEAEKKIQNRMLAGDLKPEFERLSGGYYVLMNRFLEVPEKLANEKSALNDEVIRFGLSTLWDSCSFGSRGQLMSIYRKEKIKEVGEYLEKTGLVARQGGGWTFFSPLWTAWIREMLAGQEVVIEEKEGVLWVGGADSQEKLSYQEYQLLKLLWDNKGQTVDRDRVAKMLWADEVEEKYSDWAIDQLVSKLRRKIGDIGENKKIVTAKGVGFYLRV